MGKKTYYMGASNEHSAPRGTTADDTRTTTEGVAASGEVSNHGTVSHIEHRDGSIDATVRPRPVKASVKVRGS